MNSSEDVDHIAEGRRIRTKYDWYKQEENSKIILSKFRKTSRYPKQFREACR